jgi:G:T-mismatch repair DNA endonuclease (very short patch repair protein)
VRKLNSTGYYPAFHNSLIQFWAFLHSTPLFVGLLDALQRVHPPLEYEDEAKKIVTGNQIPEFDDELTQAIVSFFVIKLCVESESNGIEAKIGRNYTRTFDTDPLDFFKGFFLEPFYEYLDEQIDDQRMILALLRRYKHKCEWFQREYLFRLWENDTAKGEKLLALHMYEYLHDQGLDFSIEPQSISGKADLIAAQNTDDPLIADAKVFNPEKSKGPGYIAMGFNQIYIYTLDFNEPFGYLIIFKTHEADLKFALTSQSLSTPFVVHNNKTIFILVIDIFHHEHSASKRGLLKSYEITEGDLIKIIEEERAEVAVRVNTIPETES